ncbi:MAG: hypothetical protein R3B90_02205 [Planctomycetaceae bacterium]
MERLVNLKKQEVQNWETRLQEKRQDVIARRIDLAMAQAQLAPEALSSIYAENAEIPKEERRIRDDAADVRAQTDAVRKDIVDLQARYGDLQDRDATAAGSTALGYRLRQQRDVLPEVATLRHEINARLRDAGGRASRRRTGRRSSTVSGMSRKRRPSSSPSTRRPMTSRGAVARASGGMGRREQRLVRHRAPHHRLGDTGGQQAALAAVEEMIGHRRGCCGFAVTATVCVRRHLLEERSNLLWLFGGGWLDEVSRVLRVDVWHQPWWYALFMIAFSAIFFAQGRLRRQLDEAADAGLGACGVPHPRGRRCRSSRCCCRSPGPRSHCSSRFGC